jgi:hypothetical protein
MRARFPLVVVAALLVAQAGCGMSVRPRASTGDTAGPLDAGGGRRAGAVRPPPISDRYDAGPVVDRICRTASVPGGWIAVAYEAAPAGVCTRSEGVEDGYSLAVIQRHSNRPAGSVMAVCADQPLPRDWYREWNRDPDISCPGARVREGAPTSYLMRKGR